MAVKGLGKGNCLCKCNIYTYFFIYTHFFIKDLQREGTICLLCPRLVICAIGRIKFPMFCACSEMVWNDSEHTGSIGLGITNKC